MKNEKGVAFTLLLIVFLVASLLIAAGFLIQVNFFGSSNKNLASPTDSVNIASSSADLNCDQDCQAKIDGKLAQLKQDLLSQNKATSAGSFMQTVNLPKELTVSFGVIGATQATSWIDVPGAEIKFNIANYPGAKGFYFQAVLQSDAPDRATYARVYDVTHGYNINNSDITYTGLAPTFKQSGAMSLPTGDLQLRAQFHSELNNTTIYNPRIKIVY